MKLLVVHSSVAAAIILADALEQHGADVLLAHTTDDAVRRLSSLQPDAIVVDAHLGREAQRILRELRARNLPACAVIVNATGGEDFGNFRPDALLTGSSAREIIAALRRLLAA